MSSSDVLDLHLTRLAGWLVQVVGKALLGGALACGVLGVLAVAYDSTGLLIAAISAGPLVGAAILATSDAPLPFEVED